MDNMIKIDKKRKGINIIIIDIFNIFHVRFNLIYINKNICIYFYVYIHFSQSSEIIYILIDFAFVKNYVSYSKL